ncbi:Barstar (barnase inhibitor) [Rathayibacter rathayi NCPPB 2980 = VKM Ac-1601]|nr:Barstar (barnase inhibitor) [Rathayibacter rathayi NCPPB 2980 = VKM Ac-1601]
MTTEDSLYSEFAAGMQFPYYFGYNPFAFNECMSDLGDRDVGKGVCVTITDAHVLLKESPPDVLAFLANSLRFAGEVWSTPITGSQEWDRNAKPFIVTLFSPLEQYDGIIQKWSDEQVDLIQAPVPNFKMCDL